ncbi:AAA family ATPase [Bacillus sp. FSL R12-0074]|uniref:AAA family ATPase n=1 Tax=Bacillus sp. FSL R12-0074 TaxID=2954664 RepID=UPI0030F81175
MKINFKELRITNFKNHENLNVEFGEITTISGPNGAGKSSIGEAITWVLYGIDPYGTKNEPKPIGNEEAETKVELLIQVDDKNILIGKAQKKAAKYFINEVPKKAKEFESFVDELFDKQAFLSLFNPGFFSSQHWQTQREQLLSYVGEPLKKEVFAELPKIQVELLEENLKKLSIEDLQKVHIERKKTHEKSYERASERVITLKEQYEKQKAESADVNKEKIESQLSELQTKRSEIDKTVRDCQQKQQQYNQVQYQIDVVKQQISQQKNVLTGINNEKLQDTCHTCGQALQDEAVEQVKQNKINRFEEAKQIGISMVKKLKELEASIKEMSAVEVDLNQTREIDEKIYGLNGLLRQSQQLELLQKEIDEAASTQEKIRKEKNESLAIIDAIKDFRTKRSELMVSKIQSLFTNIDVQLYETLKNGEERATFEILMDNKPYSRLSTAEKIKAGLELVEVLSKQSQLVVPCFVDNAESILHFEKPVGQLIVAKVADSNFTVSVGETNKIKKVVMKTEESEWGEYGRVSIEVDGEEMFDVHHSDSPEDNNLSRNFSDCHSVDSLMKMAYEAGKSGEVLEFEYQEVNEEEENND